MTKARDKFRVVDVVEKRVVDDKNYVVCQSGEVLHLQYKASSHGAEVLGIYYVQRTHPDIHKVQRSTGKKDKEGVEIFEGDYYIFKECKWLVVWDKDNCMFIERLIEDQFIDESPFGNLATETITITGNIRCKPEWQPINPITIKEGA